WIQVLDRELRGPVPRLEPEESKLAPCPEGRNAGQYRRARSEQPSHIPAEAHTWPALRNDSKMRAAAISAVHACNSILARTHHALEGLESHERIEPVFRGNIRHALGLEVVILCGHEQIECVGSVDGSLVGRELSRIGDRRLEQGRT